MKKLVFFGIIIVSLLAIKNLVFSIYDLWKRQDLVMAAQRELEAEKQRSMQLRVKISTVQSSGYIEEQARNKLFLAKEGEREIIIPQNLLGGSEAAKLNREIQDPNWLQWWKLFF